MKEFVVVLALLIIYCSTVVYGVGVFIQSTHLMFQPEILGIIGATSLLIAVLDKLRMKED